MHAYTYREYSGLQPQQPDGIPLDPGCLEGYDKVWLREERMRRGHDFPSFIRQCPALYHIRSESLTHTLLLGRELCVSVPALQGAEVRNLELEADITITLAGRQLLRLPL